LPIRRSEHRTPGNERGPKQRPSGPTRSCAAGKFDIFPERRLQHFAAKSVADDALVLTEIYEAATSEDTKPRQRTTRLVSRRLANWHGPDSSVGKAITEAGAAAH